MSRYLIVNGDDLGLSPGVNRGILEAHRNGILNSTTVMMNMPYAEAGIEQFQREAPLVGIGLHINLTTGTPVLPPERIPSLVQRDGMFRYVPDDPLRPVASFTPEDVEAEVQAQFDLFVQLAGKKPDHLDSHHHAMYSFPAGLCVLFRLAKQNNLPIRRGCRWNMDENAAYPEYDAPQLILSFSPRWPDYFERRFFDKGSTLDNLQALLKALPEGSSELMCHPGYNDGFRQKYAAQRENELAVLTNPMLPTLISEEGIEMITFKEAMQLMEKD